MSDKTYSVWGITITQAQKDAVERGDLKPSDIHPSLDFEVRSGELSLDELDSVAGGTAGKAKKEAADDVEWEWPDLNINRYVPQ